MEEGKEKEAPRPETTIFLRQSKTAGREWSTHKRNAFDWFLRTCSDWAFKLKRNGGSNITGKCLTTVFGKSGDVRAPLPSQRMSLEAAFDAVRCGCSDGILRLCYSDVSNEANASSIVEFLNNDKEVPARVKVHYSNSSGFDILSKSHTDMLGQYLGQDGCKIQELRLSDFDLTNKEEIARYSTIFVGLRNNSTVTSLGLHLNRALPPHCDALWKIVCNLLNGFFGL